MTTATPAVPRPAARRADMRPDALQIQMDYARKLADSTMIPDEYGGKPSNVLWAIGYAEMLGLHPIAVMHGMHNMNGKPTASSAFIGMLVRNAGHRLDVFMEGKTAVAELTRADAPDRTFRVEWTWDRAEQAKVTRKSIWSQFPQAMLKARAATEIARDNAADALFGILYTPEELGAEVDENEHVVSARANEPAQRAASDDTLRQKWENALTTATEQGYEKLCELRTHAVKSFGANNQYVQRLDAEIQRQDPWVKPAPGEQQETINENTGDQADGDAASETGQTTQHPATPAPAGADEPAKLGDVAREMFPNAAEGGQQPDNAPTSEDGAEFAAQEIAKTLEELRGMAEAAETAEELANVEGELKATGSSAKDALGDGHRLTGEIREEWSRVNGLRRNAEQQVAA